MARPIYFLIPFWGERYREYFINYCLPSLLAPKNLPLLRAADGHRLLIATTAEDWQAIEHLPIVIALRRHVTPVLLEIPDPGKTTPGQLDSILYQNHCQRLLLETAYPDRVYVSMIWPDIILSDGMVETLLRHIKAGCNTVVVNALRQTQEDVLEELFERGYLDRGKPASQTAQPLVIPQRVLADMQVRHLHSEVMIFQDADRNPVELPYRFWFVPGGRGLIIHSFYAQPLLMNLAAIDHHDTACLDHEIFEVSYLGRNFQKCSGMHIVQDSDEFGILSLTPASVGGRAHRVLPQVSQWAWDIIRRQDIRRAMATNAHRRDDTLKRDFFRIPIRWHSGDLDETWHQEERRIGAIIEHAIGDYYDGSPKDARGWPLPRRRSIEDWLGKIDWARIVAHQPKISSYAEMIAIILLLRLRDWMARHARRLPFPEHLRVIYKAAKGDSEARGRIRRKITSILMVKR